MAKKAKTKKKSTALARRGDRSPATSTALRVRINDPSGLMKPQVVNLEAAGGVLGPHASTGTLGLVEVKLTEKEELELSTAVNPADVLIKPTGQPYLPHRVYTAWFNRAFGRLGWTMVPKAEPTKGQLVKDADSEKEKNRQLVLVPYALHVHGAPVAFAWGEQEYSESNAEQTFGDAVEATVANALRRVAKRMGVGLELWDRDWLEDWKRKNAVQVKVKYPNFNRAIDRWRRITDPPLPFEVKAAKGGEVVHDDTIDATVYGVVEEQRQRPPAGNDGQGSEKITVPQRKRLATIARKAGREDADVRLYLKATWKVNSSADILRKDYDAICRAIEARGALPMPGDGQGE